MSTEQFFIIWLIIILAMGVGDDIYDIVFAFMVLFGVAFFYELLPLSWLGF